MLKKLVRICSANFQNLFYKKGFGIVTCVPANASIVELKMEALKLATYHCAVKQGKTGNAKKHCDYIYREGRYAGGKMKEDLVYKELGNLPSWAQCAGDFFECADLYERANGYAYTEFELALPAEISLDENIKLVQKFVKKHIGNNKVFAWAIHEKMAALSPDQRQPHAHIMFSERKIIDKENCKPPYQFFKRYNRKFPERGGYIKDNRFTKNFTDGKKEIRFVRESWENFVNEAYEKKGLNLHVSCLSLVERNEQLAYRANNALSKNEWRSYNEANYLPQPHLGPKLANKIQQDILSNGSVFKLISDKAQLVFLSKKIKELNAAILEKIEIIQTVQKEKEKLSNSFDELKTQFADDGIEISGVQLISKIYKVCGDMGKLIEKNNAKINELSKEVLSDDRISKLAAAIYTKGATTQYKKEARKLIEQRKKFEEEFKIFRTQVVPKDMDKRVEYDATYERLMNWQKKLLLKEKNFAYNQALLTKELEQPEHKENIKAIEKVIRDKNDKKKETLEGLKQENRECRHIGRQMLLLNRQLNRKLKYKINDNTNAVLKMPDKNISALRSAIEDIKYSVSKLHDARSLENQHNGMSVQLHSDNSNKEGQDIGI